MELVESAEESRKNATASIAGASLDEWCSTSEGAAERRETAFRKAMHQGGIVSEQYLRLIKKEVERLRRTGQLHSISTGAMHQRTQLQQQQEQQEMELLRQQVLQRQQEQQQQQSQQQSQQQRSQQQRRLQQQRQQQQQQSRPPPHSPSALDSRLSNLQDQERDLSQASPKVAAARQPAVKGKKTPLSSALPDMPALTPSTADVLSA